MKSRSVFAALLLAAFVAAVPAASPVSAGHVSYWNSSHGCCPKVTMVLEVCHPCNGCIIPVEVCLPACCEGEPKVTSRGTLIGCGLTKYTWCCGRSVTIRFWKGNKVTVAYN